MTETTSIQHLMREHDASWPIVRQPGLATCIAQATIGSFFGTFLVMIARILVVYHPYNSSLVFILPFFMAVGLATGVVAGVLIWAAAREADGPVLGITRSLIGMLVIALGWFAPWYLWLREEISPDLNFWLVALVVVPGLSLGSITGSRLRPWRELVRGGETKATLLKILAGFIGLVLRSVVVFSFLVWFTVGAHDVRYYYLGTDPTEELLPQWVIWWLLILGHFALGAVVLFARMKFRRLVLLTVITVCPVLAWLPTWYAEDRYFFIGYLGVWALFLLTRWRQTDIAWSYLKAELRYYLID